MRTGYSKNRVLVASKPPIRVRGTEMQNQRRIRIMKVVKGMAPVLWLAHRREFRKVRIENEMPGKKHETFDEMENHDRLFPASRVLRSQTATNPAMNPRSR